MDRNPQAGVWRPLSDLLAEYRLPEGAVLLAGDPVGPHRLSNILEALRKAGRVELRARPVMPHASPTPIPPGEWHCYVLEEGADRITHVHSRTTYYSVEFRRSVGAPGVAPPPGPRDPVMRLILVEAQKHTTRPTPNRMIAWLRKQSSSHAAPTPGSIAKMLRRYWRG